MKDEGYEVEANGMLATVFSAPNYCDQMGNKGTARLRQTRVLLGHATTLADATFANATPADATRLMPAATGAILSFDNEGEYLVTQFEAVPHPPMRPMAYASGMGGMFGF